MESLGPDLIKIFQIIWINVILSGDNAVVIALACRGLPADQRRIGMTLGAGVAILMRIVFTFIVVTLLTTPFLKMAGALLLLWIAVKLITDEEDEADIKASDRLWNAVRTIAVADAVMSLDNVIAIAAVAEDSYFLLILGLAISIPLIIAGAGLIMTVLERFPVLVWAGAALLGWIAGDMFLSDPWLVDRYGADTTHRFELPAKIFGALLVLALGALLRKRRGVTAA
jgi:YjbE family integral membrane protein